MNNGSLRTSSSKLAGAVSLAVTIAVSSGFAQSNQTVELDPFEVSGKYLYSSQVNALETPTPIIDVPQSLSIITADQITLQGFNSIGDLIDYTPGVNTSMGEGHRDAVVFRGVRSTADFFVDGVRDDVQYYRPLYNLEQVEILRGPNALLFGRGGTGGIINRVTKKAVVGENFNAYQVSLDSFGEFGTQIDSNFDLNGSGGFRLNASFESLDNHRDFYDGERIGINPTARLQLSENSVVDLSYEYIDHQRFIDRGIPTGTDGLPVESLQDIVFGDPELNTNELEAHLLRAALEQDFSDTLKGNFSLFYGDYDKLYQNLYASSYSQATTPDLVTLDGYVDTTQRENLAFSGNLIGEFLGDTISHTIIVGFEVMDTTSDQDRYNTYWMPDENSDSDTEIFDISRPLNLSGGVGVNSNGTTVTNDFTADLNDFTQVGIDVFSLYIQDEIELSEQFDVVIGARFDSFDIDVLDVKNDSRASRKDEEISPRLGFVYKPQENVSLYASYSESFLPRSGEQFANISGDKALLDPDVFENSEIGIKWDIDPSLSFTAAYFQNEETRAARDNDTGENFEVRGLEVDGIELQIQGRVAEDLFITAGYSYLDGTTASGEQPRELPQNTLSLWSNYQVTDEFGIGFGATYQDESLISDGSTRRLPSYTRFDAAAYYDVSEDLRLQLKLENLTDELYFPNAHSSHQAAVGASFNARLSVIGRF